MAYFLKISHLKKGDYLQIYESFYDKKTKKPKNRNVKPIGYLNDLITTGIEDPVSYYKKEVLKLNKKTKEEKQTAKIKEISSDPTRNLGYFLIKSVFTSLGVKEHLDLLGGIYNNKFSLADFLVSLTSARVINPCSKLKTFEEVLPSLYEDNDFTLDNIYDGLPLVGSEHQRILEIFNHFFTKKYKRKTGKVYFDCTNYYFEIDSEKEDKQKGPSKENRKEPIIGMGLLLDEQQIPLAMKMYPGNESEKPILREVINDMKERYDIKGKTIQVADKGLNCSKNIIEAIKNKDGYIFSQSAKKLEEKEKKWVLLDNDYIDVKDSDGNISYSYKYCIDDFGYTIEDEQKKTRVNLKQIRIAIYNPKLAEKKKYEIDRLVEKAKRLKLCQAKKSEYGEASRYIDFLSIDKKGEVSDESKIVPQIDQEKIEQDKALAGYNLIISSELDMDPNEIYSVYHQLWRIEETFRILKSQLDARPVYLQKKESIYGHFLICFLAIFCLRVLQIKVFEDKISVNKIIDFCRDLRVIKHKNEIINLANKDKIELISKTLNIELTKYFLTDSIIKKVLNFKI